MFNQTLLPTHVAFIVDGNRRWAKQNRLKAITGHRRVALKVLDELVLHCLKRGIAYVTFWVFSTENWKRGDTFVQPLMQLFREVLQRDDTIFDQKGVRLHTIGDIDAFPADIVQAIRNKEKESAKHDKLVVTIALNYGGRDELLRAMKKLVANRLTMDREQPHSTPINWDPAHWLDDITPEELASHLDTHDLPDPDLIIRTSGEQRLSGFMPWQGVYAELAFPKTLFPNFTTQEFDQILTDFAQRQRRFGGG